VFLLASPSSENVTVCPEEGPSAAGVSTAGMATPGAFKHFAIFWMACGKHMKHYQSFCSYFVDVFTTTCMNIRCLLCVCAALCFCAKDE
jgi:hypothetical protein